MPKPTSTPQLTVQRPILGATTELDTEDCEEEDLMPLRKLVAKMDT